MDSGNPSKFPLDLIMLSVVRERHEGAAGQRDSWPFCTSASGFSDESRAYRCISAPRLLDVAGKAA